MRHENAVECVDIAYITSSLRMWSLCGMHYGVHLTQNKLLRIMPRRYESNYEDEWWECANWRRFFTDEINEGVGYAIFPEGETGVDRECEVVFANFGGVVHWKWLEGSTTWKVAHRIDHIQPLHDKVIFADGEVDPSEYLIEATAKWTEFVLEEQIHFTGPNPCLNEITCSFGPAIFASRPVPIASHYVCWGAEEAFSTHVGDREVPIYTPWANHSVNTDLDIVYFAAHVPKSSRAGSSAI